MDQWHDSWTLLADQCVHVAFDSSDESKDNSIDHFLLLAHLKANIYNKLAIRLSTIFFSSL